MTPEAKIEMMVAALEDGKTLMINAMGARMKLKATYAAYKHFGADIFKVDNSGMGVGVKIRSGNTWAPITNAGFA